MGSAKLRFWADSSMMPETTKPTTSPCSVAMGPPLLPGETGTEIWNTLMPSERRMPLSSPSETVDSSPSGAPMATRRCPIFTLSELPSVTVGNPNPATRRSAMSRFSSTASRPITGYSSPLASRTVASPAPASTCAAVAITPSPDRMKPLPELSWAPPT